jgi:hypothetical protein
MTLFAKSLAQIVEEHPYPDYAEWWPMGETFLRCMSDAIVTQWRTFHQSLQWMANFAFTDEPPPVRLSKIERDSASPLLRAHSRLIGRISRDPGCV